MNHRLQRQLALLAAVAALAALGLLRPEPAVPVEYTDLSDDVHRALGLDDETCPRRVRPAWGAGTYVHGASKVEITAYYPPLPDDGWHLWRRMIHWPQGYSARFARLREKMEDDDSRVFRVVVLGGSMTGGAACSQGGVDNKQCAWPRRVEVALREYFGKDRVEVTNLARGGTQSEVAVGTLFSLLTGRRASDVDLVITDYAVNDAAEFGGNAGHASAMNGDADNLYEKAAAVSESLVNGVRDWSDTSNNESSDSDDAAHPGSMHLMVFSHCHLCPLESPIFNAMRDVALSEGVGYVDARHMSTEAGTEWQWFPRVTHPDFRSHQVLADIVSHALLKEALRPDCKSTERASVAKPELLAQLPKCDKPKTLYDANALFPKIAADDGAAIVPVPYITTGDFQLIEDTAGKPGWISEDVDSSVTFTVTFGQVPSLTVMYLRSYDHMGDFEITMNNVGYNLRGSWEKQMSTVQVFNSQAYSIESQVDTLYANDEDHFGMIGFGVAPFSEHEITITNLGNEADPSNTKTKIVTVMTC